METRNFEDMMRTYLAKKCQIMLDIKSLYPKYTYIQDEYLDRDTENFKEINMCKIAEYGLSYFEIKKKLETVSEEKSDRSVYAASFGASIAERSKGKTELSSEEAENIAKCNFREIVSGLKTIFDNTRPGFHELWTERFLQYLSEPCSEKLKSKNHRLLKFKESHNMLIKTKKNWDNIDREFFLKNLESIFEYDDDFEKYLTSGLKQTSIECIKSIKDKIINIISVSQSNPDFIEIKNRSEAMVIEKKKREYKVVNQGTIFLDFLKSFVNVDKGITKKGGLKLKEIREDKYKMGCSISKDKKMQIAWQGKKDRIVLELSKVISSYVSVYNSLGDSVNLSPHKLGLEMAYCTCDNKEKMNAIHHIHLPNFEEKLFEPYQIAEPEMIAKEEKLKGCDRTIEELSRRRNTYLSFVENNRKLEESNRIYREMKLVEELEKIKLRKRAEEEERLRSIYSRINEEYNCEKEKLKVRIRKGTETLDKMIEARNESIRIENETRLKEFSSKQNELLQGSLKFIALDKLKKISIEEELILEEIRGMGLSYQEECKVLKERITGVYKKINIMKEENRNRKKKEWEDRMSLKKKKEVSNIYSLLEDSDSGNEDFIQDEEDEPIIEPENEDPKSEKVEYPKLVEFKNRYELLYEREDLVKESEKMANLFMSSSKNLELVCRVDVHKRKAEKIRESINERVYEYGYCTKRTVREINEAFGSHYIKKYNVRGIKELIQLIFICYRANVYLDYKYIKDNYGMKRCQSKYFLKAIQMSLNELSRAKINPRIKETEKKVNIEFNDSNN